MTTPELLPCPKCQSNYISLRHQKMWGNNVIGFLECERCGFIGPSWLSSDLDFLVKDTKRAWNAQPRN